MALKDTWVDKVDGVDENKAEHINQVANAVIDLEKKKILTEENIAQTTGDSTTAVMSQKAVTAEVNALKSDITELQTALIGVSELIGGDA